MVTYTAGMASQNRTSPHAVPPSRDGFSALADPSRRRIIALLAEREHTVKEIAAHFAMSRPAISKHLRVLREAGLVREERRGRERVQRFDGTALRPIADWVERYESHWRRSLATLKQLVEEDR
ncbi:MAG: metalloregulator ArsR/SmtB family transcription factor [Candidatus Eiseniibacteriota bacterium]|jgi:DNA-binding transcriptional ArsR family regulator